jgi:hypothetical protein
MSDSDSAPELVPFESGASSDSESSEGLPALDKRALDEKKKFESDKKGARRPGDPHVNVAPAYSSSSFPQGCGRAGGRDVLEHGIGGMPDPNKLTASELKRFCKEKSIDFMGCLEKSDFQKVVHAWIREEFARMASNGASLACGLCFAASARARVCIVFVVCICWVYRRDTPAKHHSRTPCGHSRHDV